MIIYHTQTLRRYEYTFCKVVHIGILLCVQFGFWFKSISFLKWPRNVYYNKSVKMIFVNNQLCNLRSKLHILLMNFLLSRINTSKWTKLVSDKERVSYFTSLLKFKSAECLPTTCTSEMKAAATHDRCRLPFSVRISVKYYLIMEHFIYDTLLSFVRISLS